MLVHTNKQSMVKYQRESSNEFLLIQKVNTTCVDVSGGDRFITGPWRIRAYVVSKRPLINVGTQDLCAIHKTVQNKDNTGISRRVLAERMNLRSDLPIVLFFYIASMIHKI